VILYKYASDNGLKIIQDLRLKVSPPNEFNDPFEVTPNSRRARPLPNMLADARNNADRYRGVYDNMAEDGHKGTFEQFIKDLHVELPKRYSEYKRLSRKETSKRDMETVDDVSSLLGILCLSEPNNNIPMWSYYAGNHCGIVYGIDINKINSRIGVFRNFVKYCKHRTRHDPDNPLARQQRIKTIFTKSRDWEHEQEYRLVFRLGDLVSLPINKGKGKGYFLDISSDTIQEIIFGCRIAPDLESKIREEIQRRKKTFEHVRLFRCERHESKFELKIVPV
jgi:hypothetical protein